MKKYLALLALCGACTTTPVASPDLIEPMQDRTFETTNVEMVFQAVKTVLKADGYDMKKEEILAGTIVANRQEKDSMAKFNSMFNGGGNFRTAENTEIAVDLRKDGTSVLARAMMIHQEQYSMGSTQEEKVTDWQTYKTFYDKVSAELKLRQAPGNH